MPVSLSAAVPAHRAATLDEESGAELVPDAQALASLSGEDELGDDFLTVERAEVPPLERCLGGQGAPRRWPRFGGGSPPGRVTPLQLAVARAARALADPADDERGRWTDVVSLCLGEQLDLDAVVGACVGGPPSVPERLLAGERHEALTVLLPHLRRREWGGLCRLRWGAGTYLGPLADARPTGAGIWLGDEGVRVVGAWAGGAAAGTMAWAQEGLAWKGPLGAGQLRDGFGQLTLADGTTVRGTWRGNRLDGAALVAWPDGVRYGGRLRQEAPPVPHGAGRLVGADGSETEGDFDEGCLNRLGAYTYPPTSALSGWRYEGPFVCGRKHGTGLIRPTGEPGRGRQMAPLRAEFRRDQLLARCPAGRALAGERRG